MLFKWIVSICITIIVIFSSIVGGKKLLAYVEKENKNIQTERVANEKEKKVAEESHKLVKVKLFLLCTKWYTKR